MGTRKGAVPVDLTEEDVPRHMDISLFTRVRNLVMGTAQTPPAPVSAAPAEPEPTKPLRERYIKVDLHANGSYTVMRAPRGWWFDRRIVMPITGRRGSADEGWTEYTTLVNLEHVADDAEGIWCYRTM